MAHTGSSVDHPTVDLSIIIVSWNVWDLLRACLQAIERVSRLSGGNPAVRVIGPPAQPATLEVIVVDSASEDATVDGVRALFPWVRLITSTENLGFTRGNNHGYRESRGSFVFFLNPDTDFTPTIDAPAGEISNALWELFTAIRNDPKVGLVGPQLRYADGSVQSSRRCFPTPLTGFWESTWLAQCWPENPWSRHLRMADWPATLRQDVDWVVGAAMLARRTALQAIMSPGDPGPFDEAFFMYSEELDLCRRLRQAGWRIVYAPEAVIIHYEGRSSEQVVAARHIHFNTSKVLYYQKYFGNFWMELLRRYLLLEFRVQLGLEWLKWRLGHKRALRVARIKVYRQVLATGLRPAPRSIHAAQADLTVE
jgi:GT2 family glycosyltransferase